MSWSGQLQLPRVAGMATIAERRASRASNGHDEDDLDALAKPILTRRKDFIDKEEEARKSPNRVLYFRRNADYDRLIEACSRKLSSNPSNIRALLIRASSYLKKGTYGACASLEQQHAAGSSAVAAPFSICHSDLKASAVNIANMQACIVCRDPELPSAAHDC